MGGGGGGKGRSEGTLCECMGGLLRHTVGRERHMCTGGGGPLGTRDSEDKAGNRGEGEEKLGGKSFEK